MSVENFTKASSAFHGFSQLKAQMNLTGLSHVIPTILNSAFIIICHSLSACPDIDYEAGVWICPKADRPAIQTLLQQHKNQSTEINSFYIFILIGILSVYFRSLTNKSREMRRMRPVT